MTFFLSLVIVTCFAMPFALRSAAIARLILDASLLHCTRERPTLLNYARSRLSAECGFLSTLLVCSLSAECGRLC